MNLLWIVLLGLCWGSFLNVVGYRLIADVSFLYPRSRCPFCNRPLAWFELIPLISWFCLWGRCRSCREPISVLYPFIEALTAAIAVGLFYTIFPSDMVACLPLSLSYKQGASFGLYALFFSALIVGTRTDLHAMVVFQVTTLWLVPLGLLGAFVGLTRISFAESLGGAFFGYAVLFLMAIMFKKIAKREGIGEGDMDFMALIGAFLGPVGAWLSILIGSCLGLLFGVIYLIVMSQDKGTRIPFIPFLSLGALCFFFFERTLMALFFPGF